MTKKKEDVAAASSTSIRKNSAKQLDKNPAGMRFLIMRRKAKKEGDDITMFKVNPILVGRVVRGQGDIIEMKLIRDGGLLIKAKDYKTANNVFQLTGFPCFDVVVEEFTQLNKSIGVIHDRSLVAATDEEIMAELTKENCTKVRRISKTFADGVKRDTGTFFLTFGQIALPKAINIGYSHLQVTAFVPNPIRCFKCQKFGHVSSYCRSDDKICMNCGLKEHTQEGEKCKNPKKCVNCESTDHNSMARDCPEFLYRKKIEDIKVHEQKSHIEATRLLDSRDPMAKPSKVPRKTFATVTAGKKCNCPCACSNNISTMPTSSVQQPAQQRGIAVQPLPARTTAKSMFDDLLQGPNYTKVPSGTKYVNTKPMSMQPPTHENRKRGNDNAQTAADDTEVVMTSDEEARMKKTKKTLDDLPITSDDDDDTMQTN